MSKKDKYRNGRFLSISIINEDLSNDKCYFKLACVSGSMILVNRIIKLGTDNYDDGLYSGCKGGHIKIVNRMVELGANYCKTCDKDANEHKTSKN